LWYYFHDLFHDLEMYMVAAYIVEHLTNGSFPEFLTEEILKPLGMLSSSYVFKEASRIGVVTDEFVAAAIGDAKGEGKPKIYKAAPFFDEEGDASVIAGAGGVISNARDMVPISFTFLFSYKFSFRRDGYNSSSWMADIRRQTKASYLCPEWQKPLKALLSLTTFPSTSYLALAYMEWVK